MNDQSEDLASLVGRLRAQKWASRRDADRETGIPYATWQNIELRGTIPTIATLTLIADKLGVSEMELVSAALVSQATRALRSSEMMASRMASEI